MVNIKKLHWELANAGLPVESVCEDGRIEYSRALTTSEISQAATIFTNHDPVDYVEARRDNAEAVAKAIPGWASWTEQQAVDYIQTNVTNLASAKTVLLAMARLLVALRDREFPGLRGELK